MSGTGLVGVRICDLLVGVVVLIVPEQAVSNIVSDARENIQTVNCFNRYDERELFVGFNSFFIPELCIDYSFFFINFFVFFSSS